MVLDYRNLDLYFHMSNHYRKIRKARSIINCYSPRLGCNAIPKCPNCNRQGVQAQKCTARVVYPQCLGTSENIQVITTCHCHSTQQKQQQQQQNRSQSGNSGGYSKAAGRRRSNDLTPVIKPMRNSSNSSVKKTSSRNPSPTPSTSSKKSNKETFVDQPVALLNISEVAENGLLALEPVPELPDELPFLEPERDENVQKITVSDPYANVGEHEYVHFLLRITEDILRQNLYTDKEMQSVFDSHFVANQQRLDPVKMQEQIDYLKSELNSPRFNATDSPSCVKWDDDKKQLIVTDCPKSKDPPGSCTCLNPNCGQKIACTPTNTPVHSNQNVVEAEGPKSVEEITENTKIFSGEVTFNPPAPLILTDDQPSPFEIRKPRDSIVVAISRAESMLSHRPKSSDLILNFQLTELNRGNYQSTSSIQKKALRKQGRFSDYVLIKGPIYLPKKIVENEEVKIFIEDDVVDLGDPNDLNKHVHLSMTQEIIDPDIIINNNINDVCTIDFNDNDTVMDEQIELIEDVDKQADNKKPNEDALTSISKIVRPEDVPEELFMTTSVTRTDTQMIEEMLFDEMSPDDESPNSSTADVNANEPEQIFKYEIPEKSEEKHQPEPVIDDNVSDYVKAKKEKSSVVRIESPLSTKKNIDEYDESDGDPACFCAKTMNKNAVKIKLADDDENETYVRLLGPVYVPKYIADTKITPISFDDLSTHSDTASHKKSVVIGMSQVNLYKPEDAQDNEDLTVSISAELRENIIASQREDIITDFEDDEEDNSPKLVEEVPVQDKPIIKDSVISSNLNDEAKFAEKLNKFEIECKNFEDNQKMLELELDKYSFVYKSNEFGDTMYHFLLKDATTSMSDFDGDPTAPISTKTYPESKSSSSFNIPNYEEDKTIPEEDENEIEEHKDDEEEHKDDEEEHKEDEEENESSKSESEDVEEEEEIEEKKQIEDKVSEKTTTSKESPLAKPIIKKTEDPLMKPSEQTNPSLMSPYETEMRFKSTSFQVEAIEIPHKSDLPRVTSSSSTEMYVRQRIDSLTIEKEMSRRNITENKIKELPVLNKESSSDLVASESKFIRKRPTLDTDVAGVGSAHEILAKLDRMPSRTSQNEDTLEQVKGTMKQFRTIEIDDSGAGKFNLVDVGPEDIVIKKEHDYNTIATPDTVQKTESMTDNERCLLCCGKKKK